MSAKTRSDAKRARYKLSDLEAQLYERVTNYVRDEFNRNNALDNEGRKGTVGFALTILPAPSSIFT